MRSRYRGNLGNIPSIARTTSHLLDPMPTPIAIQLKPVEGLIKEITMKPVTNINVIRSGLVSMAAICLSMAIYVVSQVIVG
jgi:hypothetical protein